MATTHFGGYHRAVSTSTWSTISTFAALLAYRLTDAFLINTFFQPDEYFQSLEPAWQIAFGRDSGAWITWEWRECLRSSIHPLIFAGAYRAADQISHLFQADLDVRSILLLGAPKVVQAVFGATSDFYTMKLAAQMYGHDSMSVLGALVITISSPWQWFCSVRTFSNSLETTLTILGLTYWPWAWISLQHEGQRLSQSSLNDLYISLTAAAVACILRPTNILIWIVTTVSTLLQSNDLRITKKLVESSILCGSGVLALSLGVDKFYYGKWTFPPLNFLYVNLVRSLAVFYGRNRVDYYFTEGLPLLLTTLLPLAGIGLYRSLRRSHTKSPFYIQQNIAFTLAIAILTTVFALTTIAHKEVRFIYPLLPLFHVLAAKPLTQLYNSSTNRTLSIIAFPTLVINCVLALYLSRIHQSGVINVMHHLRHTHEVQLVHNTSAITTVAFLMPCHSTPWRSHLIYPSIKAWALTCEPPLEIPLSERGNYMDEADMFYADPIGWVEKYITTWPENVVMFAQLEPTLREVLEIRGYSECWRGFNTHWHDDWRRQGDVVVWCVDGEVAARQ